ncbi:ABC transporter permease [Isoptericola sp. b441]|uniref:ABC transporter permease n=1 Tax=Actinotalea lenta TaxID=3064654 RepID=A0ABT9DBU1_9CELL|nr:MULTISPECIES: ABC transporter permease [unclassified Isoptericola]MDO8108349.1 ABC transporter permease [Isoptericola sp. b441]MDO8119748.1 ABC transporter permease [Isoptericola sp. b490]
MSEQRNALRDVNSRVEAGWSAVLERVHVAHGVGRMALLLVLTFTFFAVQRPGVFLNPVNLTNMGIAAPEIGLLSLAVMIAMLTGGIDLSVVAMANGTAITVSSLYTAVGDAQGQAAAEGWAPLIVLVGVLVGVLLGAFNGFLVSVVGITPILATLGTMQLYNGLALVWTGGVTISGAPSALRSMGGTAVAGIPVLTIILVLCAVLLAVVINRTPIGRKVQLQGANPVAARYSGISPRSTLMMTYVISGLLSAVAGLLFLSRNPSASADYGSSYVLLVIVIVVLGGTNPAGGFATVLGVLLATLTLQVVASGFSALRLSAYEYAIAQGVILIGVMVLDQVRFRRRPLRRRPGMQDRPVPTPAEK